MTTEQLQQASPSDSLCSRCRVKHDYYKTGEKEFCKKERDLKAFLAASDPLAEYLKRLASKYWKDPEMKKLINGAGYEPR